MAGLLHFLSRIRLVKRRSRILTKVVVITAIVLPMLALLTLRSAILGEEDRAETLRAQAAALEAENACLEQNIEELGTVQSVRRIAQEELGLADPDTVMLTPDE